MNKQLHFPFPANGAMTRARQLQLWPKKGTRKKVIPHFLGSHASTEELAGGFRRGNVYQK